MRGEGRALPVGTAEVCLRTGLTKAVPPCLDWGHHTAIPGGKGAMMGRCFALPVVMKGWSTSCGRSQEQPPGEGLLF